MFTDNLYGCISMIKFMEKFYGWVSWMKFNAIDYGYDEGDGLKLISNLGINLS
jgi:hypothetical protein